MKERKARAENDAKMARFEAEAMARAQRIAEAALFGLTDDGDDPEAIAARQALASAGGVNDGTTPDEVVGRGASDAGGGDM